MSEVIGDAEGVEARNKKVKAAAAKADAAIAAIMQHPETRAWVYGLLANCGMFRSSFDRSALSMAFNEGQRNIGLGVTAEIMRVVPESYTQMVREAERDNG